MKVKVLVEDQSFDIPCAAGTQSIKWLALVASNLFGASVNGTATRGSVHQRERTNFASGAYIPCNVTNEDGKSLSSKLKINEATFPGETVRVHLQKNLKFSAVGVPEQTAWAVTAFSSNSILKNIHKSAYNASKIKEREMIDRDNAIEDELLIRVFGSSTDEISTQFKEDWKKVHEKLSTGSDPLVQDAKELSDLKNTAGRYYKEIQMVFRDFSGFLVGEPKSISFTEFCHFLHQCRVCDVVLDQKGVKKIFKSANFEPVVDELNPDGSFLSCDFLEALIRFSILKDNLLEISPSQAFNELINKNVIPYADSPFPAAKEVLMNAEFQIVCYEHFELLQKIFYIYCKMDKSQDKKVHQLGTLNILEFHKLLQDSKLIRIDQNKRKKSKTKAKKTVSDPIISMKPSDLRINSQTNKMVCEAFETTQGQKIQESKTSGSRDVDDLRDLNEMTFPEFVFALYYFSNMQKKQAKKAESNNSEETINLHEDLEEFTKVIEAITNLVNDEEEPAELSK